MPKKSRRRGGAKRQAAAGRGGGSAASASSTGAAAAAAATAAALGAGDWRRPEEHRLIRESMVQFLYENGRSNYEMEHGKAPPECWATAGLEQAVAIEKRLYESANSLGEYCDQSTLADRVKRAAIEKRIVPEHVLNANSVSEAKLFLVKSEMPKILDAILPPTFKKEDVPQSLMDDLVKGVLDSLREGHDYAEILEKAKDILGNRPQPVALTESTSEMPPPASPSTCGVDDQLWPIPRRVELLQRVYLKFKNAVYQGDAKTAVDICINTLRLPRCQTAQLRAPMLMWWHSIMLAMREDEVAPAQKGMGAAFFDLDEHTSKVLRDMCNDKEEDMSVRSLAMLIRAECLFDPRHRSRSSSSVEASYRRRANIYANQVVPDEFLNGVELTDFVGKSYIFDVNFFASCLALAKTRLHFLEGPARSPDQTIDFEAKPRKEANAELFYPYSLSVGGGYCDCCGKTPVEAGMVVLYKCKTCRLSHYCSTTCQANAWEDGHRDRCKQCGRFEAGDILVLQGLDKASELNNHFVKVEGNAPNGRWSVRILNSRTAGAGTGRLIAVKKKNLRHHRPLK